MSVKSWDSSVSIVTRLQAGRPLFDSRQEQRFLSVRHHAQADHPTHPASRPTCTGSSFPGVKAAEAWNWPLTSSLCRGEEYVKLYLHFPYVFMAWYLTKHKENFTITSFQCLCPIVGEGLSEHMVAPYLSDPGL